MKKSDLEKLLKSEEVKNNPKLERELENVLILERELENVLINTYGDEIYISVWTKLSNITYKYLLDNGLDCNLLLTKAINSNNEEILDLVLSYKPNLNSLSYHYIDRISITSAEKLIAHGLPANILLRTALDIAHGEKRDQFFDLALANKADLSSISYYDLKNISINEAQTLATHGLPANILLRTALEIEQGDKHDQFFDLALENKPDLSSISYYELKNISANEAEKLIAHGLPANILLRTALEIQPGEKHDQLLDFALKQKINWNNISLSSSISQMDLDKLLSHGLDLNEALKSILGSYCYYNGVITDEIQKQINLTEFLIEKGANFNQVYSIPKYFPYENYEYLLQHGMNGSHLLRIVFDIEPGERHDQLFELALANKPDLSSISYYNIKNISANEAQKLLDLGLPANILLRAALEIEPGERHDQLLDLALNQKINWSNISLSSSISQMDLDKLLSHGVDLNEALKSILSNNCYYNGVITDDIQKQINLTESLIEKGANFSQVYWVPEYFPYETYEYLLQHSMNGLHLLRRVFNIEPGERHDQLLDLALSKKPDLSSIDYYSIKNISASLAKKLLEHGLPASTLLRTALDIEQGEKRDQLLDLALTKKINWDEIYEFNKFTLKDLEKCLEYNLKPDTVLEKVLSGLKQAYKPDAEEYISASLSDKNKQIIELLVTKGADINKAMSELAAYISFTSDNGVSVPYIIPEKILQVLAQDYSLDPQLILKYALRNSSIDLLNFSISINDNFELSLDDYITYISGSDFAFATKIIELFPNIFDKDKFYEFARAAGGSEINIQQFIDQHHLMEEYIVARNNKESSLSEDELQILDNSFPLENIEHHKDIKLSNNYGYTPLHLALIANRYDLATKLVQAGCDIYAKSNNNVTPLQIVANQQNDASSFIQEIGKIIDDVDIDLGNGQSLADILITNQELAKEVIGRSHDSLFSLFKEGVDLFLPSQDNSKTSIAISHGDGFWSSGVWSTARLMASQHPEVKFYLVNDEMLTKGGEAFIKQFDAVINPGAGDSYPKSMEEFGKEDCPFSMNLEKHYQQMLEYTDKFNIPYLGMCAGSQHFSMYHGGKLMPLEGYNHGQHQVTFIAGTLPHFLSLNQDQQKKALTSCEFPQISFKGDTAHHYAAVVKKLGDGMQLGAVSEDNVAMSYAHSNGIRYSTQYHPEHHYNPNDLNITHEELWLDNFVSIAKMHHDHRVNNDTHPIEYFSLVSEKLAGCLSSELNVEGN